MSKLRTLLYILIGIGLGFKVIDLYRERRAVLYEENCRCEEFIHRYGVTMRRVRGG